MSLMSVHHVDVIFGSNPGSAFEYLDAGQTQAEIREKTHHVVAVRDASLNLYEGEILVLMGLSGSGKSSLLRCFNGLNCATRGQVCFENMPVSDFGKLRRSQISMVFQQPNLLPWRTVSQNVALGLEIRHEPSAKQVKRCLEAVGLDAWAESYPHELSGGMKQRVGIARAMATGARLLLMDEPFSALDPLTRSELQQELLRLQRESGKTIVFVTHDLHEALTLGNRIAIMEAGRLIQVDEPQLIMDRPQNHYVAQFVRQIQEHCPRCGHQAVV